MCGTCFFTIFVIVLTAANLCANAEDPYIAAVVEYNAVRSIIPDNVMKNAQNFSRLMNEAKLSNVDIIVFPEYGLNGDNETDNSIIPDPESKIAPCDYNFTSQAVKFISCSARQMKIYAVINTLEATCSTRFNLSQCSEKSNATYNTNVVFDRNGTVIARHRKFHLFYEAGVKKAGEPQITIFSTDFGVRFGVMTCFEILFEYPGRYLIERGIKDIVFATAWSTGLPYHIATSVFYGWAYTNDVNLLVAGNNNVSVGSTGSAIFLGKYDIPAEFSSETTASKLLVAKVSRTSQSTDKSKTNPTITHDHPKMLQVLRELENGTHELITNKFSKKLCHKNLCCSFNVVYEPSKSRTAYYRAYVFEGVSDLQGMSSAGTESCLILLCSNSDVSSCAVRDVSSGNFLNITISGEFKRNHALQIPATVLQNNFLEPLRPSSFVHRIVCEKDKCNNEMHLVNSISNLIVFGIHGRDFEKDGLPVDNSILRTVKIENSNDIDSRDSASAFHLSVMVLTSAIGSLIYFAIN